MGALFGEFGVAESFMVEILAEADDRLILADTHLLIVAKLPKPITLRALVLLRNLKESCQD